jgi:hypothetical protein
MCRSHHAIEMRLHEERKARKKLQKDMKEVKSTMYPNRTPSPSGSEESSSNPPTPFEQRYANYENFDPSHSFAPYASTSHMGLTLSLVATLVSKVTPLMHLLLSSQDLAWQMRSLLVSLVPPHPDMASSSHTSLHHTNMLPFFDSSICTGPGSHWAAPHDCALMDDQ